MLKDKLIMPYFPLNGRAIHNPIENFEFRHEEKIFLEKIGF